MSVRWNVCVHRLDLGLFSHPKAFKVMESEPTLTPRGKIPSTGGSEEGRTRDSASRRTESPTHYRLSKSGPHLKHLLCYPNLTAFTHDEKDGISQPSSRLEVTVLTGRKTPSANSQPLTPLTASLA